MFYLTREKSMVLDAIAECEREGRWFTEGRFQYNYCSGDLRFIPRYNSVGERNW